MDDLELLQQKAKKYRSKLADIEVAIRVILEERIGTPAQNAGDMVGLGIDEAAEKILSERDNAWTDYKVIVEEAVRRGFNNQSKPTKNLRDTCYQTFRRRKEKFEREGFMIRLKVLAAR